MVADGAWWGEGCEETSRSKPSTCLGVLGSWHFTMIPLLNHPNSPKYLNIIISIDNSHAPSLQLLSVIFGDGFLWSFIFLSPKKIVPKLSQNDNVAGIIYKTNPLKHHDCLVKSMCLLQTTLEVQFKQTQWIVFTCFHSSSPGYIPTYRARAEFRACSTHGKTANLYIYRYL